MGKKNLDIELEDFADRLSEELSVEERTKDDNQLTSEGKKLWYALRLSNKLHWKGDYCYPNLPTDNEKAQLLKKAINNLCVVLQPYTPHLSEEIWEMLGNDGFCANISWPELENEVVDGNYELPIQVNGKLKGLISSNIDDKEEVVVKKAKKLPGVERELKDKMVRKREKVDVTHGHGKTKKKMKTKRKRNQKQSQYQKLTQTKQKIKKRTKHLLVQLVCH